MHELTPAPCQADLAHVWPEDIYIDGWLLLSAQCAVPDWLTRAVRAQVEAVVPVLDHEARYTVKVLCGPLFWADLTRRQRIVAGCYVAYLVARRHLPLTFAGRTRANARLYRRA
jgi:hypothetical protein